MNLSKLSRKKSVTVNDLLATDDVNKLLKRIIKRKDKVAEMIVITIESDGDIYWDLTPMTSTNAVGILETVKNGILLPEEDR